MCRFDHACVPLLSCFCPVCVALLSCSYAELSLCCPPLIHKLIHNLSTGYPIYALLHRNDATSGVFLTSTLQCHSIAEAQTLCPSPTKRSAPASVDRLYPAYTSPISTFIPPLYPFGREGFRTEKSTPMSACFDVTSAHEYFCARCHRLLQCCKNVIPASVRSRQSGPPGR